MSRSKLCNAIFLFGSVFRITSVPLSCAFYFSNSLHLFLSFAPSFSLSYMYIFLFTPYASHFLLLSMNCFFLLPSINLPTFSMILFVAPYILQAQCCCVALSSLYKLFFGRVKTELTDFFLLHSARCTQIVQNERVDKNTRTYKRLRCLNMKSLPRKYFATFSSFFSFFFHTPYIYQQES